MTMPAGARLGPYEIVAPLGVGGMGEVYRARDARLDRVVAIKVASDRFTERFSREAHAIAALNHTNICHLYDIGPNYLVMELVEGEELRGPLDLEHAMPIVRQLIDGIEAAHEKSIIHRDLKPANIKITPEGVVKILDFGLARAADPQPDASGSNSHVQTIGATHAGTILGTAAYMAPEQARGNRADRRSDVWSFGAVVYELVTGKQVFSGETAVDILGAVIAKEPDWAPVPDGLQRLLRACLQKEPKRRLAAIGDARLLLDDVLVSRPVSDARSHALRRFAVGAALTAILFLVTTLALAFLRFREMPPATTPVHLSVTLPDDINPAHFALSPDGRLLALHYRNQLWLRRLDSPEILPLAGTEGSRSLFWSPDSGTIGFFAQGSLKTIAVAGGQATTLCGDAGLGAGGTWNREGVILFASSPDNGLRRVAARGGACTQLTKPDPFVRRVPVFLPDGHHFFYASNAGDDARDGVYLASLTDPVGRRVLADRSSAVFVPSASGVNEGHVLFVRERTLVAQPFDADTLRFTGDAFALVQEVSVTSTGPQIAASAADNGHVVYLANARPDQQLAWFDRRGRQLSTVGSPVSRIMGLALAPDARHIASVRESSQGGWILMRRDLERGTDAVLTSAPLSPSAPVWSRDARHLAFRSGESIYVKDTEGEGPERPLLSGGSGLRFPSDFSPDGRWLVFTDVQPRTLGDIWLLAHGPNDAPHREPVAFLRTPSNESQGQISPDGNWIAYFSNESGTGQIYLRPFSGAPAGPDKIQVSASSALSPRNGELGAFEPRWRADGQELFYLEPSSATNYRLMAARIGSGANPLVGAPAPLFEFDSQTWSRQQNAFAYAPAPDGQRFLINVNAAVARPTLSVLMNWQPGPNKK
jgi:eukaryotic-like serine/threonine-protein kinase